MSAGGDGGGQWPYQDRPDDPYGQMPPYGTPPRDAAAQPYPAQPYGSAQPYPAPRSAYPGQPTYPAAGWGAVDPAAPYGRDPFSGEALSDKSKVAAGLLQIFLGGFGVGRFYLGFTGIGALQLVLTIVGWATSWLIIGIFLLVGVAAWVFIEGIIYLAAGGRDARGFKLR